MMPSEIAGPNRIVYRTPAICASMRGSACDDPRIKATLYDFDAAGMLQPITYV